MTIKSRRKRKYLESAPLMFLRMVNSKCVFKYPFYGKRKLSPADCFERNKTAHFFVCLATADLISISVSPTNFSKVQ